MRTHSDCSRQKSRPTFWEPLDSLESHCITNSGTSVLTTRQIIFEDLKSKEFTFYHFIVDSMTNTSLVVFLTSYHLSVTDHHRHQYYHGKFQYKNKLKKMNGNTSPISFQVTSKPLPLVIQFEREMIGKYFYIDVLDTVLLFKGRSKDY